MGNGFFGIRLVFWDDVGSCVGLELLSWDE